MIIKTGSTKIFDDIRDLEKLAKAREEYKMAIEAELYIHEIPLLPSWTNKQYKSQGYVQNLYHLSCDCPDYVEKKRKYRAKRDVRRLCRHLYWKLTQTAAKDFIDDLSREFSRAVAIHGIDKFLKKNMNGNIVYLGFKDGNHWINVYVNENGEWKRYSYNLKQRRWSYERKPELNSEFFE